MNNTLYLMHIPWQWAKQRPHFIAQYLHKKQKIDVFYLKGFNLKSFSESEQPGFVKGLFRLPLMHTVVNKFLNIYIIRFQIKKILHKYKFVWLTDPVFYKPIKGVRPKTCKLIYDCMDDHAEFSAIKQNNRNLNQLFKVEKSLISESDIVFFSSDYLKNKLINRYGLDANLAKFKVVNNAIKPPEDFGNKVFDIDSFLPSNIRDSSQLITYIGTVSDWFDFDLLINTLKDNPSVVFMIVGPADRKIPVHDRMIYVGPVKHEFIQDIMSKSDALMMPFIVNELIRSVNPVKAYEYIYSCKPTIMSRYGESEKFDEYVYLYSDIREFDSLIKRLVIGELPNKNQKAKIMSFVDSNTWQSRVGEVQMLLKELDNG